MILRLLPVLVVLGVAVGWSPMAAGDTLTPDQQTAADQLDADIALPRYSLGSSGGYSYTYTDPEQVSSSCVSSSVPLDCTANAGAVSENSDISAESTTPELATTDGAVVDSSSLDSPTVLDATVSSAAMSSLDTTSTGAVGTTSSISSDGALASPELSGAALADPMVSDLMVDPSLAIDASDSIDPMVTDTSGAADMSVGEVAAPVRSMERGFNSRQEVDYVGQVDSNGNRLDNAVNQMATTGIKVHRLLVYWWDVQCRSSSVFDFSRYDAVVNALKNKGIRAILTPVGSPNWARVASRRTPTATGDPCHNTDARGLGIFAHPDNYSAWSVFVRQLAQHYRAQNVIGYEIWNEENSRDFWDAVGIPTRRGQAPSPSLWSALYCRAVTQIDANDPGKLVGVGGLAVHHGNSRDANGVIVNMRSSAFLQSAYAARAQRCPNTRTHSYAFDFVGYHPYAFTSYYNNANPNIGNTPAMVELRAVRGVMRARGQGRRKIWNTEWGFPSNWNGITEARQADLIRREHNYLANAHDSYGYYVRFSIYFNAFDDGQNSNVFSSIGMVHAPPDYTHKPSYATWSGLP
jgi:hypothetical protein